MKHFFLILIVTSLIYSSCTSAQSKSYDYTFTLNCTTFLTDQQNNPITESTTKHTQQGTLQLIANKESPQINLPLEQKVTTQNIIQTRIVETHTTPAGHVDQQVKPVTVQQHIELKLICDSLQSTHNSSHFISGKAVGTCSNETEDSSWRYSIHSNYKADLSMKLPKSQTQHALSLVIKEQILKHVQQQISKITTENWNEPKTPHLQTKTETEKTQQ